MHRVVISKEAKQNLDELMRRANEGFDAGEITKSDLVNWLLGNSQRLVTEQDIKSLRSMHFNETRVLASLLKGINEGEALPENLRSFLRSQYGLSENQKRKSSGAVVKPAAELTEN